MWLTLDDLTRTIHTQEWFDNHPSLECSLIEVKLV